MCFSFTPHFAAISGIDRSRRNSTGDDEFGAATGPTRNRGAPQEKPQRAVAGGGARGHYGEESRGGLLPPAANTRGGGGDKSMSDDLTSSQIALLCDIGENDLLKAGADHKRDLERLISIGYVEPTANRPDSPFKLTAKGAEFLGERGAGLNEA
jgi:hypothetical protein